MNIGTKWHTDLLDEIYRTFYLPKANNEGFAICSLFIYSKNTNSGDETIYRYWKEKSQFSFALPGSETICVNPLHVGELISTTLVQRNC